MLFSLFVVARPLAAGLALDDFAFGTDGLGQLFGEVIVTTRTIRVDTVEAEKGFAVPETEFVLHSSVPYRAGGVEVIQVDPESLQFGKFLGKGGRVVDLLGAAQTVLCPGAQFWDHKFRLARLAGLIGRLRVEV